MKMLIPIIIGLLVVGCGKTEPLGSGNEYNAGLAIDQNTTTAKPVKELTLEEKIVGTYEKKFDEGTMKLVILENGTVEKYKNGEKTDDFEWKIVGEEVHLGDGMPPVGVCKIEPNGDLTAIAEIWKGERTDLPKEDQRTFKRIKVEPKETPSNGDDKITYDPVSDEEAITGADRLARVCVKALAGKNHELLLQQNPNSLPDEDYKQWAKAIWFANLERMKKEVSDMLKVFEDPDPEMKAILVKMKAILVKLQTDPDKVFDDDLKQQLEMRKLSKDGPRMETAKKEFISERNKLTVAESDWGKVDVSKVEIVRFRQRNVMKEIPFPNRQVEVTLEVDGREIKNTIRMEIVKLPRHGWKYTHLEIHLKPRNPKK